MHCPGRHIIGDNRHIKAHIVQNACRKPCSLEIGARFRAYEFYIFVLPFTFKAHKAKNGFGKALRHNRSLAWEFFHKVFRCLLNFAIASVGNCNNIIKNRLLNAAVRSCGTHRRIKTARGNLAHPLCSCRSCI